MHMAKRAKMDGESARQEITADELRAVIGEINGHKEDASEASGLAGKATQQACERFGIDRHALTVVRKFWAMEPAKRGGILRAVLRYSDKAGFFDEDDMFDPLADILREIVAKLESNGASRAADPVIEGLAS
jgi:hypothetical protein